MTYFIHLLLALACYLMPLAKSFAESEKREKMREFKAGSNEITITQSGEKSSGIVVQQDKNGTTIHSWGDKKIKVEAKDNKDTLDLDSTEPDKNKSGNNLKVKQRGSRNSISIRQE